MKARIFYIGGHLTPGSTAQIVDDNGQVVAEGPVPASHPTYGENGPARIGYAIALLGWQATFDRQFEFSPDGSHAEFDVEPLVHS